uniref:Uncharacterized protein n=1 Tax=Timema tahoe TaxID=61484 RepID=A0A7R9IMI8_9NEOP|nr:unnamed protein product [Timema tahoe]
MEGEASVKIESEEDLEYNLHQEEEFEIKSEIDLPIKSEEGFKEEIQDYQQLEYCPRLISFPPIKEELPNGLKYLLQIPLTTKYLSSLVVQWLTRNVELPTRNIKKT